MTSLNAVSTLFGGTAPHRLEELYGVGFSDDGVAPASGPINLRAFNGKTPLRFSEQRAKLVASDSGNGDKFGSSVDVDGDTAVIGSIANDDHGTNSGSAYIFTRDTAGDTTSSWTQRVKLTASDAAAFDYFGGSQSRDGVAIDGDTVAISAVGGDNKSSRVKVGGAVYVFTRDTPGSLTSGWTQRAKLTASDGVSGDQFGENVSIDGDTVVIGANRDDDNGNDSGSVYIFNRDAAGNWTQSAKLTAADASSPDDFGVHVTIEEDTIVIGARFKSVNGYSLIGSAYVFTRNAAGNWTQHSKLLASDGTLSNSPTFGDNVAISGNTMLIAASGTGNGPGFGAGEPDSGAVYVFTLEITPINP